MQTGWHCRQSVQDGVRGWRCSGACCQELNFQLGQFAFKLPIDHDECANDATAIAMAGSNQVIDFRIELGHKNLLARFRMASLIRRVLHQY